MFNRVEQILRPRGGGETIRNSHSPLEFVIDICLDRGNPSGMRRRTQEFTSGLNRLLRRLTRGKALQHFMCLAEKTPTLGDERGHRSKDLTTTIRLGIRTKTHEAK